VAHLNLEGSTKRKEQRELEASTKGKEEREMEAFIISIFK